MEGMKARPAVKEMRRDRVNKRVAEKCEGRKMGKSEREEEARRERRHLWRGRAVRGGGKREKRTAVDGCRRRGDREG